MFGALRGAMGAADGCVLSPGSAVSASFGSFGASGEQPAPTPAAPPLLIITNVP
jgi:hypothetical protein